MPVKKVYITRYLRSCHKAGELTPDQISRLERIGFSFSSRSRCRSVACYETGETWPSVQSASQTLGVSATRLSAALKRLTDVDGRHFYYRDDPAPRPGDLKATRRARRVTCLETGAVYESRREAADAMGCAVQAISAACDRGLRAAGMHFYYSDDPVPEPGFFSKGLTDAKEVICVETGEVFGGQGQAARCLGVSQSAIHNAVKTGTAVSGLHFAFHDAFLHGGLSLKPPRTRGVRCMDTGEEFDSVADANEAVGLARRSSAIGHSIRNGTRAAGRRWEYVGGARNVSPAREVRCVEQGLTFGCLRDAAVFAGVSRSAISRAIGRHGKSGGYHWEYV